MVTEALRRGGIVNPSAAQITAATDFQLREVAKDIHLFAGPLPSLLTTAVDTCVIGQSDYPWPTDADSIRSLVLLEATDDFTGTAQAGGSTSITLAASFDQDEDEVRGKRVWIASGTGVDQINQITAYNNTTKVATVSTTWTTNPASGSAYRIATYHRKLWDRSKPFDHDLQESPYVTGLPRYATMLGRNVWLNQPPDRLYGLWFDYWQDIDRIDTAGSAYLRLIRDYFTIFLTGIAAKVMDRYDDDRAGGELAKYNALLANLAGENSTVSQVLYTDL